MNIESVRRVRIDIKTIGADESAAGLKKVADAETTLVGASEKATRATQSREQGLRQLAQAREQAEQAMLSMQREIQRELQMLEMTRQAFAQSTIANDNYSRSSAPPLPSPAQWPMR